MSVFERMEMDDKTHVPTKHVWYSQEEKIVSTQPKSGYQEVSFASLEEWFNFIQDLTKGGYRIT